MFMFCFYIVDLRFCGNKQSVTKIGIVKIGWTKYIVDTSSKKAKTYPS